MIKSLFTFPFIVIVFNCFGQIKDSCFETLNYGRKTDKNFTIEFNNCENYHYLQDTITQKRTKITIYGSKDKGRVYFQHGFLFTGGDMKYLSSYSDKVLIYNAHFILFDDKDSIVTFATS